MNRVRLIALCFLAFTAPSSALASRPPRPVAALSRVLLVSVDGLRPDLTLRADAPVIQGLMKTGSFTLWARTTDLAVTLPSHTSMLTGVSPAKHGVTWNDVREGTPQWPTLFELAKRAGYSTAMAAGKEKFVTLRVRGTLDRSFVAGADIVPDSTVTDTAVSWIRGFAPQVLFVHLPEVDISGHGSGWGSANQLLAVARADRCLGRMIDAVRQRGVLDSTLIVVTADHGGAGKSHGSGDPRSLMIPWIASGPSVRAGFDLTSDPDVTIRTEDTFATLAYVLGITPPRPVEGHAVLRIFSPRQAH